MVAKRGKIRAMSQRFKTIALFIFFMVYGGILTGCQTLGTYNPATDRREIILISTDAEVSMGLETHQKVLSEYILSDDISKNARLQSIGQKVAKVSDRQDYTYQFFLLDKDELNAFTTPGGQIYFLTGLFDQLQGDDAIAAVIAHEIGHCAARHIAKKFQAALGVNLISSLILHHAQLTDQARQIASMSSNAVMGLVFSAFSRQDEYEADSLAIKYLYLAGYDPNGMIQAFEFLLQESKGPQMPLWMRTHPFLEDRIVRVKDQITRVKELYQPMQQP